LGVTFHKAYLQANSKELPWLVRELEAKYELKPDQVRRVRAILQQRDRSTKKAYAAKHELLPFELRNEIQNIKPSWTAPNGSSTGKTRALREQVGRNGKRCWIRRR